jgi:hypothetical protein
MYVFLRWYGCIRYKKILQKETIFEKLDDFNSPDECLGPSSAVMYTLLWVANTGGPLTVDTPLKTKCPVLRVPAAVETERKELILICVHEIFERSFWLEDYF